MSPDPPSRGECLLVTGGAGFIGSHLVERLLADNQRVVVIDDLSTGSLENLRPVLGDPNLRVIQSTVSGCGELSKVVSESRAIYHLAAAVGVELVTQSPLYTLKTNVHETEVMLEKAAEHRVPLVLTSSSEVYGRSEKDELAETDDLLIGSPDRSRWGYACSKLVDEFLALAYARERALPAVIARLFNTVGPRQTGRYGMVLPRFVESAKRNEPLKVYGDGLQKRCFCFIDDTIESLVRLQNCPAASGQIFNVGNTEEITILDLAKRVIQVLESKSGIQFVAYRDAYAAGFEDMRRRKPAVEKLERAVGFRPRTSLREIILRTAASLP